MKFFPLIFSLAQICLMAGAAQAQAPLPEAGIPLPGEFLPPPPAVEGLEFQRDQAIFWQTRAERDSDRWRQAIYDAADEKHLEDLYLAAFGLKINTRRTPATLALLRFVDQYLAASINSAKDQYKRIRPFAFFNMSGKTCTPYDEVWLSWNGAYPSGHSARGWGRALVLAELS
ncbi:MAG: hypothetical protein LBS89_03935, partial [Zoogloeaceae bacterium]|nr:hypothetical protein [Zoogloeaceae bacterium]